MDWTLVLRFLIDCVPLSLLALLFCLGFQSYCIPIIGRFATSLLLIFFGRRCCLINSIPTRAALGRSGRLYMVPT
ncbi:hypothetical protein BDR04DRAFT_868352 [Suillus decipiens]|nr:hypothetical protein BDR04DRAFT_868352 [Suillus decipiens]